MLFNCSFDTYSTRQEQGIIKNEYSKSEVDKLSIPLKGNNGQTGQKRYYDEKLKGFGVRVTSGGAKTFFIEKLIISFGKCLPLKLIIDRFLLLFLDGDSNKPSLFFATQPKNVPY
jgi:hypothetical protein